MKTRVLAFLSFAIFFSLFSVVFAQVPGSTEGLTLVVTTENPIPGQSVKVTAQSFTIDVRSSKLVWVINGKTIQNGIGLTALEVIAPALGNKLTIKVTATTPEGLIASSVLELGSGSIDLITETDGYVPPSFKGKISPVYQNAVKIVAIPHLANSKGIEYDPKTLIYEWIKNERVISDQSGYGKQSITIVGDIVPRPYDIEVIVKSRDGEAQAKNSILISTQSPFINFYEDDPLYGVLFNKSILDTIRIGSQKETSLLAIPFGFNTLNKFEDLTWSWVINSNKRPELTSHRSIILRAPANTSGSTEIRLDLRNTENILQGADNQVTAEFKADKKAEAVTFQ